MQVLVYQLLNRSVRAIGICGVGLLTVFTFLLAPSDAGAVVTTGVSCGPTPMGGVNVSMASDVCTGPTASPWVARVSASANVAAGQVSGKSRILITGVTGLTSPSEFFASSIAEYTDDFTIDISALDPGASFTLRATIGFGGILTTAISESTRGDALASAEMQLQSQGGFLGAVNSAERNGILIFENLTRVVDVPFSNGVARSLTLRLMTRTQVNNNSGFGDALAEADFENTGGIIGFEYFALDGALLAGTFSTTDGDFTFYDPTPIPEPGTALLLGCGLALMAWRDGPSGPEQSASKRNTH